MELDILGKELAHRIIIAMLLAESRLDLDVMHKRLTDTLQSHAPHETTDEEQTLTRYIESACAELDEIFAEAQQRRIQSAR